MVKLLTDPRIFNCILMTLNLCSALRWALAGRWWNTGYWIAAFVLTGAVTFGDLRK